MKLSIAKKLGIGFGAVIILMIASAAIAYYNLGIVARSIASVTDEAVPATRSCDRLASAVHESLAALRGYLILGDDPQDAQIYKSQRKAAWQKIDLQLLQLTDFVHQWNDQQASECLSAVEKMLREFRDAQQRVEAIAHTDDNVPAMSLLISDFIPLAADMTECLTALIDLEKREESSDVRRRLLAELADSRAAFVKSLSSLQMFVLTADPQDKANWEKNWSQVAGSLARLQSTRSLMTSEQHERFDKYVELTGEHNSLALELMAMRQADDWNRAEHFLETDAAPKAVQVMGRIATLVQIAESRQQGSRHQLDAASQTVSSSLLIATTVAIILAALIAAMLSRKIVVMIRLLAERASAISKGDLTGSAIVCSSHDELGQLADGFDDMLVGLKDLTRQILSVTENVNSATSQISASAKQQASSTKEQAATIQEITSTMKEISQSGSQIVERAREVAAAAESASQKSNLGISAVQNTNRTMETIRDQVEEVAENIVALSEKTQAVGEIIATVNDIAEQSNLLALNATIEAADAGDDGNRFSVVANEMKNLADQAKDCTVQVSSILGEIQKGINTAVMLTEEAVKRVESGKEHAEISEEAIRDMMGTSQESVQAFQQIIGATNQQQIGFQQLANGMQDIDTATQQTATGTSQLEQAVASLSAMSQQLKTAVSSYKLQA
ncbi:MAG: methyl-accepting chemotaxis protein [Phycisphaera sp. RhM]|nr:methyl-accepting chemotaxis protein [Phycisphaera sp. RhM]